MREQNRNSLRYMVHAAAIAAIYTVLTILFAPISFGPIQLRVSEALCILPVFTPAAIPGIFAGCLLSNFLGGAMPADILFGSMASLLGAYGTYLLREKKYLASLPPIVSNALIIPFVLRYAYGVSDLIPFMMLTVGIGELLAVGIFGNMLMAALAKYEHVLFGQIIGEQEGLPPASDL